MSLGAMTFGSDADEAQSRSIMDRAADLGITAIDTADVYPTPVDPRNWGRSEEIVGRWLRGKRDRFVVATKFANRVGDGPNDLGGSRRHIIAACEASLRRLGTDYIDIYYAMYLHEAQLAAPFEEVFSALEYLQQSGKICYVGVSNFHMWELSLAMELIAEQRLAKISAVQVRYNLINRAPERDILPLAERAGFGVITYNPLGGGILADIFRRDQPLPEDGRFAQQHYRNLYWNDDVFALLDVLREIAAEEGINTAQVALAWLLAQPGVTSPLVGALEPAHLDSSVGALSVTLTERSLARLNDASWPPGE